MKRLKTRDFRYRIFFLVFALSCLLPVLYLSRYSARLEKKTSGLELEISSLSNSLVSVRADISKIRTEQPKTQNLESTETDTYEPPKPRLLGIGNNGRFLYLDVETFDEFGESQTRRIYQRLPQPIKPLMRDYK